MTKYEFCKVQECPKFKEAEERALRVNNSAFDAASDMWDFVDKCCLTCPQMSEDLKNDFWTEYYNRERGNNNA